MRSGDRTRFLVDERPGCPPVLWLENGILRIGVLPAAGGRILSVGFRGQETLWRNADLLDDGLHPVSDHVIEPTSGEMADWHNYGGDKTWPAPQGWSGPDEWAGPPDAVLDSGEYTWQHREHEEGISVELTSGDDPRTGLRITRELTLRDGEASYELSLRAQNTSDRTVSWALWNVTQRQAGEAGHGGVWVGVEPGELELVELVPGTGVPAAERSGEVVHVPHQDVVGKLGFPTATGWLAHAAHGSTTTQAFRVDRELAYPDGGSRVEVWMEYPLDAPLTHLGGLQPSARIVEIEVLGPRVDLEPGRSTQLQLRIGVGDGIAPVSAVSEAGHWGAPTPTGDSCAIDFFPYASGSLELASSGARLAEVNAGEKIRVHASERLWDEPVRVCSEDGMSVWKAGILAGPARDEGAEG